MSWGRWSIVAIGPTSSVEPEVTMGQPDGLLRRELGVDKNKDRQTLAGNTGNCISLSSTPALPLHGLQDKLLLFAMELHLHLAQDSEKLMEEIWQDLEEP